MPSFGVHAGTPTEIRDARGPHNLTMGADDKGEELRTLAPGVFAGGGGAPVFSPYGQFAALLLDSVVRVPAVGGPNPGRLLGLYRCSDTAFARWWSTALGIVERMEAVPQDRFWGSLQRGKFIEALRIATISACAVES